jgi:hypothetical protein
VTKRTIYRDSKTGRFAKRSTWQRSKGHGGTRYKQETVTIPVKRRHIPPVLALPLRTFFVTFKYVNARGTRSFDFFTRAKNAKDAEKYVRSFVNTNPPRLMSFTGNIFNQLESFNWESKEIAEIPSTEWDEYDNEKEGWVKYQ